MRAMSSVAAILLGLSCLGARAGTDALLDRQGPDLWRASKLVGVDVLGPDGRKVGDVSEVLLDHDGRAAAVVIGVGGFLGIGVKDVALPYAALHFTSAPRPGAPAPAAPGPGSTAGMPTEPGMAADSAIPVETAAAQREPPAATAPAAVGGPVGTTSGVPGGMVTGQAAAPVPAGQAGAPPRSTARPDHGTIDLTFDQLKAAPAFTYAP